MTTNHTDRVPKISIGMPVYNGEKFIRKAIDSLLAQTMTDFELIISDNASTDNTEAICQEYVVRDSRVRYVRQDENMGARANFQYVLDQALGEFFIWAAHDDSCHPEMLSICATMLDLNPDIILCISDIIKIDDNDNIIGIEKLINIYDDSHWNKTRRFFFEFPISNVFFAIYGLYRTNILRSVGVPIPLGCDYYTNSEVPFLAKLSLYGKITALPLSLKYYRVHDDSCYSKELELMSWLDYKRLRLEIRTDLCKTIFGSCLPTFEKYFLLQALLYSWLKAFTKGSVKAILRIFLKHKFI
jgi:glycosyltransferase involved in cell wall biosynthesis